MSIKRYGIEGGVGTGGPVSSTHHESSGTF